MMKLKKKTAFNVSMLKKMKRLDVRTTLQQENEGRRICTTTIACKLHTLFEAF